MRNIQLQVFVANTWKEKTLGLLRYKKPESLFLQTRFGIHTFGLSHPIDVLILDKHYVVIALKESLKPNRVFFWNPKYNAVVELPQGTITQKKIVHGTKIILKER